MDGEDYEKYINIDIVRKIQENKSNASETHSIEITSGSNDNVHDVSPQNELQDSNAASNNNDHTSTSSPPGSSNVSPRANEQQHSSPRESDQQQSSPPTSEYQQSSPRESEQQQSSASASASEYQQSSPRESEQQQSSPTASEYLQSSPRDSEQKQSNPQRDNDDDDDDDDDNRYSMDLSHDVISPRSDESNEDNQQNHHHHQVTERDDVVEEEVKANETDIVTTSNTTNGTTTADSKPRTHSMEIQNALAFSSRDDMLTTQSVDKQKTESTPPRESLYGPMSPPTSEATAAAAATPSKDFTHLTREALKKLPPNTEYTNSSGVGVKKPRRRSSVKSVNAEITRETNDLIETSYISPAGRNIQFKAHEPLSFMHFISESRFVNWTREEMIAVIIHLGIHIRYENEFSKLDFIEFCDALFEGKSMPKKRHVLTNEEKNKMEHGIWLFQNIWIYHQYKAQTRTQNTKELQAINATIEDEFDFSQELFDINDDSMLYATTTPTINNMNEIDETGSIKREKVSKKTQKERLQTANKLISILDRPWEPPSWDIARKSLDFTHPRRGGKGGPQYDIFTTTTGRHCYLGGCGEQCDLWKEGQVSEFSIYGPGVTNYYKFLKWCGWILFVLSIISLPSLIINIYGGTVTGSGLKALASTTVGNLENVVTNETVSVLLPLCSVSLYGDICYLHRESLGKFYMYLDIAISAVIIAGYIWLKIFENLEEINLNKNTVYTSMFTIQVKNISPHTESRALVSHIENVLQKKYRIIDIDFAYDNEIEIRKCIERGNLIKKKSHLVNLHRYQCTKIRQDKSITYDESEELVAKLRQKFFEQCKVTDQQLREYDTILQELEYKCDVTKAAFITFADCVGAYMAKKVFKKSFFDYFFVDRHLLFEGRQLDVRQAPEPSTIIWENLQISYQEIFFRRSLTTFLASLLILISLGLAFGARILQSRYTQTNIECSSTFYKYDKSTQRDMAAADSTVLHCYCDQLSGIQQRHDSVCRQYLYRSIASEVLIYFASLIVLGINSLIEYVIAYFSDYEKHQSADTKEKSLFSRLFILKYLNTAIVFLISSDQNIFKFDANYKVTTDFNLAWYESIGITILLVQIGNIFVVQGPTIYQYFVYKATIQAVKISPQLALTQSELNEIHVGPPMLISYRYAQILAVFFVTLTFNTGMPVMNMIATANYIVFYCLEKFFFIKLYRAPYRFGSELGKSATNLIPFGLIIHLAMSMWILSNQRVFQTGTASDTTSTIVSQGTNSVLKVNIGQKVTEPQTLPLFIMFLLLIGGFVAFYLFKQFDANWRRFYHWIVGNKSDYDIENIKRIRRKLGFGANINGGFLRAVQRNLIKDLAYYSILKNPVYKEKFAISWTFAAKHRRVSEVRFSTNSGVVGGRGSRHSAESRDALSDTSSDAGGGDGKDDRSQRDSNSSSITMEDMEKVIGVEESTILGGDDEDDIIKAEEIRRHREAFESDMEREQRLSEYKAPTPQRRRSRGISFGNNKDSNVRVSAEISSNRDNNEQSSIGIMVPVENMEIQKQNQLYVQVLPTNSGGPSRRGSKLMSTSSDLDDDEKQSYANLGTIPLPRSPASSPPPRPQTTISPTNRSPTQRTISSHPNSPAAAAIKDSYSTTSPSRSPTTGGDRRVSFNSHDNSSEVMKTNENDHIINPSDIGRYSDYSNNSTRSPSSSLPLSPFPTQNTPQFHRGSSGYIESYDKIYNNHSSNDETDIMPSQDLNYIRQQEYVTLESPTRRQQHANRVSGNHLTPQTQVEFISNASAGRGTRSVSRTANEEKRRSRG